VHGLGATQTKLLGCLVHRILRKRDELLDIPDRSLHIHGRNMEAKRGKLDGYHILGMGDILSELLNIQGTSEHSEQVPVRSRGQSLGSVKLAIHVRQQGMAIPTGHIRERDVVIEVGQGTLGRAIVPFARVHVLVGVVADRKDRGTPWKGMAAPHAS
jgi:hypothetical protein